MKKIIILLDSGLFGGIESHIIELSKLLKKNKIEFEILFYKNHNNQQLYYLLKKSSFKFEFLDGNIYSLFKFLMKNKNIILHTHGYKCGILGRIFSKMLSIPCISTFHAGEKGNGRIYIYNKIDQITSFLSKNIIVSNKLKNFVYKPLQINNFIIPNKLENKKTNKKINVAFVGRLSYEKAPERFIELASKYITNKNIKFNIYGTGVLEKELKKYAPYNVNFLGHQANKNFFKNIDILIICSRQEGLPMVLLEAMNYKIICLSNSVGQIPEVINDNFDGFLTSNESVFELKRCFDKIINLSEFQKEKIKLNAYKNLVSNFSGKSQIDLLKNIYFS